MQPIVRFIESNAKARPTHTALITGELETSYKELWAQINVAAAWYRDNGVAAGDTVVISADSRDPYYVAAYFGAHLAGAVAVPMSFRASEHQVAQRMNFTASTFDVFRARLAEFRDLMATAADVPQPLHAFEMPKLSDLAELMFTTGSTGEPKAVALSHGNIAASAELIRTFVGNAKEDREVVTVPLTHSFGLGRLRATLVAGGTIVLVPGLTFPQLALSALREHSATGLACVPAGIVLLLSRSESTLREFAGQLRYIEIGSARLLTKYKERLREIFPTTRLCMHYGLTEASRSTFIEFHQDHEHIESIGRPSPGVEVSIVGDSGSELPVGQTGMIHVRAQTVMQGYWNNDKLTDRVLDRKSGWLSTGDLGYVDADGYVHLVGRADDVINSGGVSVIPDDVEKIAMGFSGVEDCGCIGVPDPDGVLGEVPKLFVVTGYADFDWTLFNRHVHSRLGSLVPKVIISDIDKLPRSDSGKLLRQELRTLDAPDQTRA